MIGIALILKAFQKCQVSGDGFPNFANGSRWFAEDPRSHPKLKLQRPNFKTWMLKYFWSDLARSAKKVSRSVKEGHGKVSDMPKHPDLANSAFGGPSGWHVLTLVAVNFSLYSSH